MTVTQSESCGFFLFTRLTDEFCTHFFFFFKPWISFLSISCLRYSQNCSPVEQWWGDEMPVQTSVTRLPLENQRQDAKRCSACSWSLHNLVISCVTLCSGVLWRRVPPNSLCPHLLFCAIMCFLLSLVIFASSVSSSFSCLNSFFFSGLK